MPHCSERFRYDIAYFQFNGVFTAVGLRVIDADHNGVMSDDDDIEDLETNQDVVLEQAHDAVSAYIVAQVDNASRLLDGLALPSGQLATNACINPTSAKDADVAARRARELLAHADPTDVSVRLSALRLNQASDHFNAMLSAATERYERSAVACRADCVRPAATVSAQPRFELPQLSGRSR